MNSIRYWQGQPGAPTQNSSDRVKQARQAVDKFDKSFQTELMGQLSTLDADALMSGSTNGLLSGGGIGSGMFGKKGPQLMDLDIDGIEKVWAAQMNSPLDYFGGMGSGSGSFNSDNSSTSGLSGVVDLMVKEQIAKARKQIEQQQTNYSFDEFVKDVGGESVIDSPATPPPATLDDFISRVNTQINDAAQQYAIPEEDIRKRLLGY